MKRYLDSIFAKNNNLGVYSIAKETKLILQFIQVLLLTSILVACGEPPSSPTINEQLDDLKVGYVAVVGGENSITVLGKFSSIDSCHGTTVDTEIGFDTIFIKVNEVINDGICLFEITEKKHEKTFDNVPMGNYKLEVEGAETDQTNVEVK